MKLTEAISVIGLYFFELMISVIKSAGTSFRVRGLNVNLLRNTGTSNENTVTTTPAKYF